jgi:ribosomal protein L11 methylase PrmA
VHKYIADDGVLLASGIIMERSSDVVNCFEQHGFEIVERAEENGWCALAVKLKK